jgi:hypothetical protein
MDLGLVTREHSQATEKSGITRAMNIAKQLAKYRWIQTHI